MQLIQELPATGRKLRRPKHTFTIKQRPWQITPFFIAPVLPGETLKNLLCQARIISDPVKAPIIGWWGEQYYFYVKHRDLAQRDTLTNMMLNPTQDMSALKASAANQKTFVGAGGIDWVQMCLERVVEEYFRDEGKAWNEYVVDGLPMAYLFGKEENWADSLTLDAAMPDIDPNDTSAQQLDPQYQQWEYMRAMKLVNMTYEEWLRTFGVNTVTEIHKPELVRYIRDWQYPSNTVNPADGSVSTAVSWSIAERADKDRFFKEPGFLFGVQVVRPKVYHVNQAGAAVGWLNDAFSWLPALMRDEPYTSLKEFPIGTSASEGPLKNLTQAATGTQSYWLDMRDLFLYGDAFFNFDIHADGKSNSVATPLNGDLHKHFAAADLDLFFKSNAQNQIRSEGVVSLNILGAQVDHT